MITRLPRPLVASGTFGSVLHARNRATGKPGNGYCILLISHRKVVDDIHGILLVTGEHVAIKLLGLGDKFYSKYVDREILNHHQLAHPHIVAFKEIFLTRDYLCIVMEYVGGGNLQQWVEKHGPLPEWQARCFFQQITLALHYIHKNLGIAHRDVKLGNILLNDQYKVPLLKLCDFGYSKRMDSVPKTRVGTAAYISPEVARSSGQIAYDTERADVWSSAVTLYCMLAGRYPFLEAGQAETDLKTITTLTSNDVDKALSRLRNVSQGCSALMKQMLAINPSDRISLDKIMIDPWFCQYLPDLSKLTVLPRKDVQSEVEILSILSQAEKLSEAKRAGSDNFANGLTTSNVDDVLDEIGASESMNLLFR